MQQSRRGAGQHKSIYSVVTMIIALLASYFPIVCGTKQSFQPPASPQQRGHPAGRGVYSLAVALFVIQPGQVVLGGSGKVSRFVELTVQETG